ncbi:MAG: hypothetical protein AAED33_04975 [Paracoccaceae bacterium]
MILGAVTLATTASAKIIGVYFRNGEQFILVRTEGDLLYCTRVSDGFEMSNGLAPRADGSWSEFTMKHPDMPKFMTYRGTAILTEVSMTLEGCTAGNAQCDSETWEKLK